MASPLASGAFRSYYAGQLLSYAGEGLRTFAMPLLVLKITNSPLATGVTYAVQMAPAAVFGLIGGSVSQRVSRRRMMLACDGVRAAAMALLAVLLVAHALSVWAIYAVIALNAAAGALFVGGQWASIPYLLGKDSSVEASSILVSSERTVNAMTPSLSGALFSAFGPFPVLITNAACFLASFASIARIGTLGPDAPRPLASASELVADVGEGFALMMADTATRMMALASFSLNFFGLMAAAALIPFLKLDLHVGDAVLGLTLSAISVGAIAGSVGSGVFGRRCAFGRTLSVAYVIDALFLLPVGFLHQAWIVAIAMSLYTATGAFEYAQILAWRIRITPEPKLSMVLAAVRLVGLLGAVPGAVAGGALGSLFGPRFAIVVAGWFYLAIALAVIAVPSVRNDAR